MYINGVKATKQDIERLKQDIKDLKLIITVHITKNGEIAVKTEF